MKRYFAAGGMILASIAYFFTQNSANGDEHGRRQIVPPDGLATTTATTTGGAPFGQPITSQPGSGGTSKSGGSGSGTAGSGTGSTGSSGGGTVATGKFKNGTYTGSAADAYYGYVQVAAVVSGGKLTDVKILQYPNDRSTSRYINSQALPYLTQEAIQAQSGSVNTISGASDTSAAFRQSLTSALAQAKP